MAIPLANDQDFNEKRDDTLKMTILSSLQAHTAYGPRDRLVCFFSLVLLVLLVQVRNRFNRLHLVKHVGRVVLGLESLESGEVLSVDVGNGGVASYENGRR